MTASTPPLETVLRLQAALAEGGVPCVVGGSALLAARGLVDVVNDWDLVVDAGRGEEARRIVTALGLPVQTVTDAHPPFATELLLIVDAGDHTIDVMVGFAVRGGDEITVRVPALAEVGRWATWNGLVLGRAEDWVPAYRAMGREERALLLARLDDSGHDSRDHPLVGEDPGVTEPARYDQGGRGPMVGGDRL